MAANFEITTDKTIDGFGLRLEGDFDATSAYELIYAIIKLPADTHRIEICTKGLMKILPGGLTVFRSFLKSSNGRSAQMLFTGNNGLRLTSGSPSLDSESSPPILAENAGEDRPTPSPAPDAEADL